MVDNPNWQAGRQQFDIREADTYPFIQARINTEITNNGLVCIVYTEAVVSSRFQERTKGALDNGVRALLELEPFSLTEGRIVSATLRFEPPGQRGRRLMARVSSTYPNEFDIAVCGRSETADDNQYASSNMNMGDLGTVQQRYERKGKGQGYGLVMVETHNETKGKRFEFTSSCGATFIVYPDNNPNGRRCLGLGDCWTEFSNSVLANQGLVRFPLQHPNFHWRKEGLAKSFRDSVEISLAKGEEDFWMQFRLSRRLRYQLNDSSQPDALERQFGKPFELNYALQTQLGDLPRVDISEMTPQEAIAKKVAELLEYTQKTWGYQEGQRI